MKSLIIVESPTKAKTLGNFLGKDYQVISTMGHIRDLPEKKLGIKIKKNNKTGKFDFQPEYVLMDKKKEAIDKLKQEGRIVTEDWSKYNYGNVIFEPKNMSREELFYKTREVAKTYYSYTNVMRRTFESSTLDSSRRINKLGHNLLYDRNFIKREYGF